MSRSRLAAKTAVFVGPRRAPPRRSALSTFTAALGGAALTFALMRPHETGTAAQAMLQDGGDSLADVTVHLFQWPHDDVARECQTVLGPSGYRWVQVSPAQEHIQGDQWWVDYQPVSYAIDSKRGNEDSFRRMVRTCKEAGVGVIADVVLNHMTGKESGTGFRGTPFKHYQYPGLFSYDDFHHCGRNGNDHIKRYDDRYEIQNCELLGLADLATEKPRVQAALASYLAHLLSLGVEGFRVDAAKHIPAKDVSKILARVEDKKADGPQLWRDAVRQEVWFSGGEPVRPEEYVRNGRVHVFQGAYDLKRMFERDGIAYLAQPTPWGQRWGDGYLPSTSSQVFVSNHDLEREDKALRWNAKGSQYWLAHVFLLTWPYGRPDVLSAFDYKKFDDGPRKGRVECGRNGWRCEHRHPAILGATAIRRAAGSAPIQNILTDGKHRLSYGRGRKGFVAINNDYRTWRAHFSTNLPAGVYCNVLVPPTLRKPTFVLPDGILDIEVPSSSAVGLFVGGTC